MQAKIVPKGLNLDQQGFSNKLDPDPNPDSAKYLDQNPDSVNTDMNTGRNVDDIPVPYLLHQGNKALKKYSMMQSTKQGIVPLIEFF
jgi:hypothetical protein